MPRGDGTDPEEGPERSVGQADQYAPLSVTQPWYMVWVDSSPKCQSVKNKINAVIRSYNSKYIIPAGYIARYIINQSIDQYTLYAIPPQNERANGYYIPPPKTTHLLYAFHIPTPSFPIPIKRCTTLFFLSTPPRFTSSKNSAGTNSRYGAVIPAGSR